MSKRGLPGRTFDPAMVVDIKGDVVAEVAEIWSAMPAPRSPASGPPSDATNWPSLGSEAIEAARKDCAERIAVPSAERGARKTISPFNCDWTMVPR